jgi:lipopolysaccharide transport system permease protein
MSTLAEPLRDAAERAVAPSPWRRALRHLNPWRLFTTLWARRSLVHQITRREVEGRYRGSLLGVAWSFVNPLVLLTAYTFVFGAVFRARWAESGGSMADYALVLFAGLIVINVFAECAVRASTLVVAVPNYVKKVVFPLEILPVSILGSALFHGLVGLVALLLAEVVLVQRIPATVAFLPLVLLPLVFLCLAVLWLLASLGVFLRDIGHMVALVVQVIPFFTPIFYPMSAVSPRIRVLLRLNPLTTIVEEFRAVAVWGREPDWIPLLSCTALCAAAMMVAYAWFMETKRGFADVI